MKSFLSICLVALCYADGVGTKSGVLKKNVLDPSTGALCLDGTPGVFYFAPSSSPANSTKYVFFFQGGGWCYDEVDCLGRSRGGLGSSKNYADTMEPPAPLSFDCSLNPTFCDYNKVWMPYCDGNSFSGNREDPLVVNGTNLYFRGHVILQQILLTVTRSLGMAKATHVGVSGCSAGGLATFIHTNFIGDFLQQNAPSVFLPGGRYGTFPISGYFLETVNTQNVAVYPTQMHYVAKMSNAKSGLDSRCVAEADRVSSTAWTRCNFAHYSYARTVYPIWPINSFFDSWQTGCILGSVLPQNFPNQTGFENGVCGAVSPTFGKCQNSFPNGCNADDRRAMIEFMGKFESDFFGNAAYQRAGNGAFIFNTHTHCAASGDAFKDYTIGGVRLNEALDAWWQLPGQPAAKNNHVCNSKVYPGNC